VKQCKIQEKLSRQQEDIRFVSSQAKDLNCCKNESDSNQFDENDQQQGFIQ
jgi:hypothetical protein